MSKTAKYLMSAALVLAFVAVVSEFDSTIRDIAQLSYSMTRLY